MSGPEPELIAGPYRAPRYPVGSWCRCAVRGQVRIDGLTDAPIPWPYSHTTGRYPSLIVRGGLLRALKIESSSAIAWHWGVSRYYASRLRRELGLTGGSGRNLTPGSRRLMSANRPRGEALANLADADVIEIRRLYAAGRSIYHLAQRFGLHDLATRRLICGITWPHLPGAVPIRGASECHGYHGD